jgi:16S rRNA (cytosine967-C5)-methyltransferase
VFGTRAFADGWFVVQDPTAIAAARAVGARPGERIVDYCAAPGTKATLLAEAVGDAGAVFAYDPSAPRRRSIVENAERLRLAQIKVCSSTGDLPHDADRVLVDVPCSNTGVLARRVEVRERIDSETFASLAELQRTILTSAVDHARPGASVVYSTCSIEPEENDPGVAAVAASRDLAVLEEVTTLPVAGSCDGGYFARHRTRA